MSTSEKPGLFSFTPPSVWRLLWLAGLFVSGFTLLGLFSRFYWFFELFIHFTLQYAAILALLMIVAFARKQKKLAIVFSVFFLVNFVPIVNSIEKPDTPGEGEHIRLKMLSINVHSNNTEFERLVRYVKKISPDIVLLVETNWRWDRNLDEIRRIYPHYIAWPRWNSYGISLYSRFPLSRKDVIYLNDVNLPTLHVTAKIKQHPVQIYGVHFAPPIGRGSASYRDRQILGMRDIIRKNNGTMIVAGDMNLTPWSPLFDDLLVDGKIKNSLSGNGTGISWPAFFLPLGIAIDHVLVSPDITVLQRTVGPNIGSDHYPVFVDMQIATGGAQ